MNIQSLHQELLSEIIKHSGQPTKHTFLDSYLGNSHPRYPISIPILRTVAKDWLKLQTLSTVDFFQLISALIMAPSSTEKMVAGILLDYAKANLKEIDPNQIDTWLNHLEGWAEIDTLCYGDFKVDDVLENWVAWKKVLVKLNKDKNINKRRASLVLLCKPLTRSSDKRIASLAFQFIESLKHEKEVLLTKAISWTLRSMVKLHRSDLKKYIQKNKSSLPAIAVRETLKKIETGKKNG
ncbi:MAG TPA: hypothetical protein DGG95_11355 [Cytophagales bacterium]|jgi:3-methyladenine DNA glycosylase AlkD|nr:hypothetical protein [Cytophagales bacterium]